MITAVCCVNFHLTEGQKVEAIYPENALDKAELAATAMTAFPDSMSFELQTDVIRRSVRDTSFFFRIARSAKGAGYLHGFVFCRQRQDERLQRGGEQKSVVILSPIPLSSVLTPLSTYAGPLCLSQGPEAMRALYEEVSSWELATWEWGGAVDLPLGHSVLRIDLPDLSSLDEAEALAATQLLGLDSLCDALCNDLDLDTGIPLSLLCTTPATGLYTDLDLFTPLAESLHNLWALWEIVLLGKPLVVAAPSPSASSAACAALLSLISPLPYAGADYRPYFTIHDPAFGPLAAGTLPGSNENDSFNFLPSLLGVTNPFILKSLAKWPNVLSTGFTTTTQVNAGQSSSCGDEVGAGIGEGNGNYGGAGGLLRKASLPLSTILRRKSTPQSLLTEPTDAVWLAYKPLTRPDDDLLEKLTLPETTDRAMRRQRLAQVNSSILRRHFEELSRAIVFPLLPYITPAPPPESVGQDAAATLATPPPLQELDVSAFVKKVASGNIAVPEILLQRFANRRNLSQFYERYLQSKTFPAWFALRREAAAAWQAPIWRMAWHEAGGAFKLPGVQNTEEVGSMEEYLKAEAEFESYLAANDSKDTDQVHAVMAVRSAFESLPQDLQEALLFSPRRKELIETAFGTDPY